MKVKIERKYWPVKAKGDDEALDVGTIVDLPDAEAKPLVNAGIASLVIDDAPQGK